MKTGHSNKYVLHTDGVHISSQYTTTRMTRVIDADGDGERNDDVSGLLTTYSYENHDRDGRSSQMYDKGEWCGTHIVLSEDGYDR
jgi:hypothetical protein